MEEQGEGWAELEREEERKFVKRLQPLRILSAWLEEAAQQYFTDCSDWAAFAAINRRAREHNQ